MGDKEGISKGTILGWLIGLEYPGRWLWRFKWYRAIFRWESERGLPKDSPARTNYPVDEG